MFLSFNKKDISKSADSNTLQERVASQLTKRCHALQSRLAATLQTKSEKLSTGAKKAWLFLFCFVASTYCLYTISRSLHIRSPVLSAVNVIKAPPLLQPHEILHKPAPEIITDNELQKVQLFKRYMDSLSQTAGGVIIRDSIIRQRPGLMDSIAELEKTFGSNTFKHK